MAKAQELCHDHPEVLMFQRRCLGAAENTFAKARARVDAGDDQMALKVNNLNISRLCVSVMYRVSHGRFKDGYCSKSFAFYCPKSGGMVPWTEALFLYY